MIDDGVTQMHEFLTALLATRKLTPQDEVDSGLARAYAGRGDGNDVARAGQDFRSAADAIRRLDDVARLHDPHGQGAARARLSARHLAQRGAREIIEVSLSAAYDPPQRAPLIPFVITRSRDHGDREWHAGGYPSVQCSWRSHWQVAAAEALHPTPDRQLRRPASAAAAAIRRGHRSCNAELVRRRTRPAVPAGR